MKKTEIVKRILLILILLANVVFICLKSDTFQSESSKRINVQMKEQVELAQEIIEIKGNMIVEQEFAPEEKRLGKLRVYFRNISPHDCVGDIKFTLMDKDKNEIYSALLDASLIKHESATVFDLSGNTEIINANRVVNRKKYQAARGIKVDEGQTYILQIQAIGVDGTSPIELMLGDLYDDFDKELSVEGQEIEGKQLWSSVVYYHFTYKVFAALVILLVLAMIIVCIPWGGMDEKFQEKWKIKISVLLSRVMFVLTPFVCYFMSFKILDVRTAKIIQMLLMPKGYLNLLTIAFVWWLVYVICNRTKYATVFTTLSFGIFAMVNYALVQFRGLPLMATDLVNVGTAMDVASSYTLSFDKPSIWIITITVTWCCVAMALESYKGVSHKGRIANVIILGAVVLLFNQVYFNSSYLKDNKIKVSNFNPTKGYKSNGCVLGFMITVTTARMEKPEGYSVEALAEIMSDYQSDKKTSAQISEQTPNIIYVMNESFADLSVIGDLGLSEDCMPFYRSLEENCIKGNMQVSSFAGQTANTEFEVLTGNTVAFLPYHTVAYTGIIKNEIPSVATSLSDIGYVGNTAFHPGMIDSYNRNIIYPYLGFENHLSIEDVENPRNIRSFLSDEHDYEILQSDYESARKENLENPYFMFNVTIQNHGGFGQDTGVVNGNITLNNAELATEALIQYENLIKHSDEALKGLLKYYEEQEEPTVIIFFGDHHPVVTKAMYQKVYKGEASSDMSNYQKRYTVPFMIWANYDIEEQSGVELSTNYLTAYMKQAVGISMTGYDKYLMELYKKVPIITGNYYKGEDGNFYTWDSETESVYTDVLNEYRLIQYNGLIDDKNIIKDFFYLSE